MSSHAFTIPAELTQDTGTWPGEGPIKWGSDEHKRLFCKTLLDTHDPYRPKVLDWPRLGAEAEKRIISAATSRILIGGEIPEALLSGAAFGDGVIRVRDLAPVIIEPDPYKVPVMTSLDVQIEVRA